MLEKYNNTNIKKKVHIIENRMYFVAVDKEQRGGNREIFVMNKSTKFS